MIHRRFSLLASFFIIVLLTQFANPLNNVSAANKCNWVQFVADVSVPDGSIFNSGVTFVKTWRLKNIGTCTWSSAYSLAFDSGEPMNATPSPLALPRSVAPGQTIDLSISMTAPSAGGHYRGYWMLKDEQGNKFGVGSAATKPFWVDIKVNPPAPTLTPSPTPAPVGLNLQGTVRLTGRGLAFVRIYRQLASYGEVLIATTDLNGKYKADFLAIPGDETITIRPAMNGFVFTPVSYSWRHYHGQENRVLDFTASFPPPPPDPTVIDFFSNMCAASWISGAGALPCPMADGDARGFAVRQNQSTQEDGNSSPGPVLVVSPQNKYNGYIQGFYPEYTVIAGDRFQATVGCAYLSSCYVTYRLDYQIGNGPLKILWSWQEKNDGKVYNTMVNLNPLAGQKVKFVLTLLASGPATNDRALWGQPRITREKSLWPTLTPVPSATPDVPRVTTASIDVRYPNPVTCGIPNPVGVYGSITTNGAANVTYYWEMDGARSSADQVLSFSSAGTLPVEFGNFNTDCGDHTARVVMTSPNFWSALIYFSLPMRGFTYTPAPSPTPTVSATPDLSTPTPTPTVTGQVSNVSATVSVPATINCASPINVDIQGNISTDGPAVVKYHWEISGDTNNTLPENTLIFDSAASMAAGVGPYAISCGDFTARLVVTSPNSTSAQANFSLAPPPALPIYDFSQFTMIGSIACSEVANYTWVPQTCNGESGGCMISQTPLFGQSQAGFLRHDGNTICGLNLP